MCFVWISEQTAIISLYNINWLVFITQTQCVYCAVRTGSLNVIQFKFHLQRLNTDKNKPGNDNNNAQAQERNFANLSRKVAHRDWPQGEWTSIESKTPPSCCYLLCQNTVYGRWGATAVFRTIKIMASSILLNAFFLKQFLPFGMSAVGRRTWHLPTSWSLPLPSALRWNDIQGYS